MAENYLHVIADLTARPEMVEEAREALVAMIEPTRAEDGCIKYELFQDNNGPTRFTFVETWTSEEALRAHFETPHMKALRSRADGLFAAPTDIRKYTFLG